LARGECWWRTFRSSWFGHQSWFVLGRVDLTVGASIAGFSLSLPSPPLPFSMSDTSFSSCSSLL
jgi:hypothetical protein